MAKNNAEVSPAQAYTAAVKKLTECGLNSVVKQLLFKPLSAEEARTATKDYYSDIALKIPYFDFAGKQIDYYRVRSLAPEFDKKLEKKKNKYWGLPNYAPQLYLPPLLKDKLTWKQVAKDPSIKLYITEGEFKAAKGTLEGFKTIGFGGVWNYGSKKRQQIIIPDLEEKFVWKNEQFAREVGIVYDSDAFRRDDLVASLYGIAEQLGKLGARVFRVDLPPSSDGKKVGFDDYLVDEGAEAFKRLPEREFDLTAALAMLNTEYVYAQNPGCIVRKRDGALQSKPAFELDVFNRTYMSWANGKPTSVQAGTEWLRWKKRNEVESIVYEPREVGDEERHPKGYFNRWSGWGAARAVKDNDKRDLFLKYIDHLCANSEKPMREWLLRWLAYPIQFPGTKIMTAAVIHGAQGGGKSMLGYIMREVYGKDNFEEITQELIEGQFNPYAEKQFILADELISSDRRHNRNKLKQMITRESVSINKKNQPSYTIKDRANYLIVSNDPKPISLEDGDRRFAIFNVNRRLPDAQREALGAMYRSESGRNAIMHFLLKEVDCKRFDIYAAAPMSEAKRRMLYDSKTAIEQFITDEVIERYDECFTLLGVVTPCDFQSTDAIANLYNGRLNADEKRTNAKVVGGVLATLAANTTLIVRLPQFEAANGKWIRAWAFRNVEEQWRNTTKDKAKKHWDEATKPEELTKGEPKKSKVASIADAKKVAFRK